MEIFHNNSQPQRKKCCAALLGVTLHRWTANCEAPARKTRKVGWGEGGGTFVVFTSYADWGQGLAVVIVHKVEKCGFPPG